MGPSVIHAVLNEWWSGYTASGEPSKHTEQVVGAAGGLVGNSRRRSLEVLSAMLAKRHSGATRVLRTVNVRFAVGSDGQDDIRIEQIEGDKRQVMRWRPQGDSLEHVYHMGTTLKLGTLKHRAALHAATAQFGNADPAAMPLSQTHVAIAVLKSRRKDFEDQLEAHALDGSDPAATTRAAADLTSALAAIRTQHDALNVARKAAARG
jgi:hypothetical protein